MEPLLSQLGLTSTEAKIYSALLRLQSTTTGPLVAKTSLHRATVYDGLKRLIEKGLVSYVTINDIKKFQASPNPHFFLEKLQREKKAFTQKEKATKEFIQKLALLKNEKDDEEARTFHGLKGARTVLEEVMLHNQYDTLSSKGGRFLDVLGNYIYRWQKTKKKRGVHHRLLVNRSLKNSKYLKNIFAQKRYLPDNQLVPSTTTYIYGNKVAFFILPEKPIVFVIESPELSGAYKHYFNFLWNLSEE